jgi:hypothetical protein
MRRLAVKMDQHRLDGHTLSAGCYTCPLLNECGGYTRRGGGWSCMDRCSTCDQNCDLVCLKKPTAFARDLLEVGGFGFRNIPPLLQPVGWSAFPRYIPVVQHGYAREEPAPLDWAALPLREVLRMRHGVYGPVAQTPAALRAHFGIAPSTSLILLGTGKDKPIEAYWRWRRRHAAPRALAQLEFAGGIVPNYSFFLEDPRPQHLFNRKRSLICATEWSREGMPVVPYLQALTDADWRYWEDFLRVHPNIQVVAKEFQTGLAAPERGERTLTRLAQLQDTVGRRLHLMAIGAARYLHRLPKLFDSWTLLDSVPFMKAVKRRVAAAVSRRIRWQPALGEPVEDLLLHNVGRYSDWVSRRATS